MSMILNLGFSNVSINKILFVLIATIVIRQSKKWGLYFQ